MNLAIVRDPISLVYILILRFREFLDSCLASAGIPIIVLQSKCLIESWEANPTW